MRFASSRPERANFLDHCRTSEHPANDNPGACNAPEI
jgi:hypothetical protein